MPVLLWHMTAYPIVVAGWIASAPRSSTPRGGPTRQGGGTAAVRGTVRGGPVREHGCRATGAMAGPKGCPAIMTTRWRTTSAEHPRNVHRRAGSGVDRHT